MQRYDSYKDSGVKWFGEIPEHWDIRPGFTCFKENKNKNKGLVEKTVLSLSYGRIVVKPEDKLTGLVPESFETYQIIRPGDIVIRPTDLQNDYTSLRVGLSKNHGIITSAYIGLRCNPDINPTYIFRLLESYDAMKVFYGMGSGLRQNMDFKDFKRLPITLPPREEQDRIVAFIDEKTAEIDTAIAKKERLIELLKEQKNILINRTVTRGLNPDVPMRDSGVEWIGEIPAHWILKKLINLARVVRGASPRPAGNPKYFTNEPVVPWVTVAEITKDDSLYLSSTSEYLTTLGARNSQAFYSGTVVFTNSGATLGVPKILAVDCCANDGVLALKSLSPEIHKEFLYLFLSTTTVRLRDEMKQGGGQPNLNTGIVKNISIPIPQYSEQITIVKFVDDYLSMHDRALASATNQIEFLNSLKVAIISNVVSGKIKII